MEAVQLRAPWAPGLLGMSPGEHDGRVRSAAEVGIDPDGRLFAEAWVRVRSGRRALPVLLAWVGLTLQADEARTVMARLEWATRDHRFLGTAGYFDAIFLPLRPGANELLVAV